mgnify:FL=1|tara:strand:+ start:1378 stop:1665 length:288 start_codon:yes stop_codon:yes gene_type:complete
MGQFNNQPDFGTSAKGIIKSDTIDNSTNIGGACLFIGTGGDVRVILAGVTDGNGNKPGLLDGVTFKNLPSGSFLPVICDYVLSAGTTASELLAIK